MTEQKEKSGLLHYIAQAWLVLTLSVCFGTALAVVEKFTRPLYEANVRRRITGKLEEMFGPGTTTTPKPVVIEQRIGKRTRPSKVKCYPALRDGQRVGWGVLATGQGYDELTLLIGLDATCETLRGYRVIKSLETPGIGDKIKPTVTDFHEQFAGQKTAEPLKLVAPDADARPGRIKNISGATISSTGVVTIVNEHLAAVAKRLAAWDEKEP